MTATTHDETAPTGLTYRFGAGSTAGVWLGLGLSRLFVLAVGLLATVALLMARAGLPLGLCPLLATAAATLVPVAGRPLLGWATPATAHGWSVGAGANRWTAPMPHVPMTGKSGLNRARLLRLPPECGQWRLTDAASGGDPLVGVLRERRSAAAVLLFAVAGPDRFGLLDPDGQDRLVAGWGRALAGFAQRDRGAGRLQLLERVAHSESERDDVPSWVRSRGDAADSALGLLHDVVAESTLRRDSLIAVRVAELRDPEEAFVRAREIAGQLLAAELVARPLSAAGIADVLRRMVSADDASDPADVGPVSRRVGWEDVRTDDRWHHSFAVTGWPGSPVPAGWLSSLLVASPPAGSWTTSLHLAAVAPQEATRMARAARARAELDRADRARLGLPASAAADKAVAESAGMDAELVAGHATHRLAAVLTCSASTPEELRDSARALRDAAAGAGLAVRPLHGQQHLALAATLPLCRLRFGGAA